MWKLHVKQLITIFGWRVNGVKFETVLKVGNIFWKNKRFGINLGLGVKVDDFFIDKEKSLGQIWD